MDNQTGSSYEIAVTPIDIVKEVIKPLVETISEGIAENLRPGYLHKEVLEAVRKCSPEHEVGLVSGPVSNDSRVGHGFQLTFRGGYIEYSLFRDVSYIEPLIIRKGTSLEGLQNRMNAMSCCTTGDKCTRAGDDCLSDTGGDDPCPSGSRSSGVFDNPVDGLNKKELDDIVDLIKSGITMPPLGGNKPSPEAEFDWCEEVKKRFIGNGDFPLCDFSDGRPPKAYHAYIKHKSGVTSLIRIIGEDSKPKIDGADRDPFKSFNNQYIVDIHEQEDGLKFLSLRPSTGDC